MRVGTLRLPFVALQSWVDVCTETHLTTASPTLHTSYNQNQRHTTIIKQLQPQNKSTGILLLLRYFFLYSDVTA